VAAVHTNPDYPGVPVITGIVSSSVLRPDGSTACKPGYDKATGLYLDTEGSYPPLMEPAEARDILLDVVCDFPFTTPAHRSAYLAALVTLLCRAAFAGPAPLFLFDGNRSGVGKGLLTDTLTMILEGRKANRYSFPGDKEELRKLITSIAVSGVPYCLFDNITDRFGGAALENAMTTGRWSDRILTTNQSIDVPLQLVWLGTSNNATLTPDMPRRVCHVRLDSDHENPSERTGFKYPDLLGYVKENRRQLAMAALSIPARFIEAGRPDQGLTPWGGFEDWSSLVRNSIVWASLPDPGKTREMLAEQTDESASQLEQLIEGWEQLGEPTTVAEAIRVVSRGEAPALAELLDDLPGNRNRALGTLLRDFRGRVLHGRKLERTNRKQPKWRVVPVGA
jgi:putative DNA primase/helicase